MWVVAKDQSKAEEDGNKDDAPTTAPRTDSVIAWDGLCWTGAAIWIVSPMGMRMPPGKLEWEETAKMEHVSSLKVRGWEMVFQKAKEWT